MNREDPLLERIDQVLAENDEPAKACGDVVSEVPVLVDEPGPAAFVMPADRGSSTDQYVGFDVEPRPERTRGWLAGWIERVLR